MLPVSVCISMQFRAYCIVQRKCWSMCRAATTCCIYRSIKSCSSRTIRMQRQQYRRLKYKSNRYGRCGATVRRGREGVEMNNKLFVVAIVLVGVVLGLANSLYIVNATERAVLLRFGEVVNADIPIG